MSLENIPLGEALAFFNGKAPAPAEDGEHTIFGSNGAIGKSNAFNHEAAIILGRVGAYCGSVAICDEKFWASDNTIVVKAENGHDLRYLYYRLLYAPLRSYAGGAAQPLLTHSILRAIRLKLHTDRDEQKRIGEILARYDHLIENNRRRIQLLEQAARLFYKEWFVRLRFPGHEHVKIIDGVPEGWGKVSLSELCNEIREQVDPSEVAPNTPYIGLEHIPRRSITLGGWGAAAEVESSKFRFAPGDILFGKIRPYLHKVGVGLTSGITSSDAIVLRVREPSLHEYLLLLVSSDEFVALASKTVREGSKMPRADWKYLSAQYFLVPPQHVVGAFAVTARAIVAQLKTLALQTRQLARARDLLLPRLMNGEIAA